MAKKVTAETRVYKLEKLISPHFNNPPLNKDESNTSLLSPAQYYSMHPAAPTSN